MPGEGQTELGLESLQDRHGHAVASDVRRVLLFDRLGQGERRRGLRARRTAGGGGGESISRWRNGQSGRGKVGYLNGVQLACLKTNSYMRSRANTDSKADTIARQLKKDGIIKCVL